MAGRAAKALEKWAASGARSGPATTSDLVKANWDGGREPWRGAAEWTWDEGLEEGAEEGVGQ